MSSEARCVTINCWAIGETYKGLEYIKEYWGNIVLWQLLIEMINSILSSLIGQESYGNHKRTQQGVSNVFLFYIYYKYIIYTSNK